MQRRMSNVPSANICPQCRAALPADAPQGLCPACLLAAVAEPTEAGPAPLAKSPPPTREQVAAAFPQLEILELIGAGGMGFVFKARQPKLDRLVALKLLPPHLGADAAFAGRFEREGRVLARLSHPNIVTVHDFGIARAGDLQSPSIAPSTPTDGDYKSPAQPTSNAQPKTQNSKLGTGFFYLLMEYVDGVNLRQAMRAGRFTPVQALEVVPKICEALQFAHEQGVLHRDIKPENILLDSKGRVKLVDFGIAKLVDDGRAELPLGFNVEAAQQRGPTSDALTSASAALGTPNYMAPEQRDRPAAVDHRADIYSLGVVFYEMLTGELPQGKFPAPSAKTPMDPRVDAVVLRALEHERERRQQSAGEMKTQVETIASSPGSSRSEEAQTSTASPRFLKIGTGTLASPEQLATMEGQFFHYRTRGQLILDDRQLTHSCDGATTVIPLAAIRDVSIGRYPLAMNPARIALLSVTYEERGQRRQVLLSPMDGFFALPATWNARVADWHQALREAVHAAMGRAPTTTPPDKLGVPAGSKLIHAMYLLPVAVGVVLFTLLARREADLVVHGFNPTPVLGILAMAMFGFLAPWLLGRKLGGSRKPVEPSSIPTHPQNERLWAKAVLLTAATLVPLGLLLAATFALKSKPQDTPLLIAVSSVVLLGGVKAILALVRGSTAGVPRSARWGAVLAVVGLLVIPAMFFGSRPMINVAERRNYEAISQKWREASSRQNAAGLARARLLRWQSAGLDLATQAELSHRVADFGVEETRYRDDAMAELRALRASPYQSSTEMKRLLFLAGGVALVGLACGVLGQVHIVRSGAGTRGEACAAFAVLALPAIAGLIGLFGRALNQTAPQFTDGTLREWLAGASIVIGTIAVGFIYWVWLRLTRGWDWGRAALVIVLVGLGVAYLPALASAGLKPFFLAPTLRLESVQLSRTEFVCQAVPLGVPDGWTVALRGVAVGRASSGKGLVFSQEVDQWMALEQPFASLQFTDTDVMNAVERGPLFMATFSEWPLLARAGAEPKTLLVLTNKLGNGFRLDAQLVPSTRRILTPAEQAARSQMSLDASRARLQTLRREHARLTEAYGTNDYRVVQNAQFIRNLETSLARRETELRPK